jgi:hypothetical protein
MDDEVRLTGESTPVRYQDEHVQFEEYLKELEEEEELEEGKKKPNKLRKLMNKDRAFQEFARKYY